VAAPRTVAAIRAHWKIENTSHYSRDVTLGEDRLPIRTNPGVFARLRSFAFDILRGNQTDTLSQDRYRAALAGIENLLRGGFQNSRTSRPATRSMHAVWSRAWTMKPSRS
jgi:hypothetical protein